MSSDRWFQEFFDHWCELRGERLVPQRTDFHPGKMRRHVSRLMVIDRTDTDQFPIALVGSDLDGHFGRDVCGQDFVDLMAIDNADEVVQRAWSPGGIRKDLSVMMEKPFALEGVLSAIGARDQALKCRFLLLPFEGRSGKLDKIFALLDFTPTMLLNDPVELVRFTVLDNLKRTELTPAPVTAQRLAADQITAH